jgi:hypothetical protein
MGTANRSEKKPNYNQIPHLALRRLAARFSVGAVEYDDPDEARKLRGAMNWQGGNEEFYKDAFNHMVDHLYAWKDGDRSDDHLAAIMWGCAVQMWGEERGTAGDPPPQV